MNDDIFYQVVLMFIFKVGVVIVCNLMSYCGGVRVVFEVIEKELKGVLGIGVQFLYNICNLDVFFMVECELDFIEVYGIQVLFYIDFGYL